MYFIILYLYDSKPVYLVDIENLELVNGQLAAKEPLSFEAFDPKDLTDLIGVHVPYSQINRVEKKRAKEHQEISPKSTIALPAS